MKLFVTNILIFITACLSAQSVGDEFVLNKVDLSNNKMVFLSLSDTLKLHPVPKFSEPVSSSTDHKIVQDSVAVAQFTTNHLNILSNGEYRASFNLVSGAYLQESDVRAKKDIRGLKDDTLEKLMLLEPISYLMKNQTNTERNIGLAAQNVQEIYPSLVHEVQGEDQSAISYIELIPIMIKAIQEQQKIIDNLRRNQYAMQKDLAISQIKIAQLVKDLTGQEMAASDSEPFRNIKK
ncbi:MAG: tail fiber domain-containing protein [Pricia sp.]|nr:tail fiber domain-containing protein [Pricia sp.]